MGTCVRTYLALEGEVPDEEEWKFLPSTLVRCELLTLSSGERLVAIEAVG